MSQFKYLFILVVLFFVPEFGAPILNKVGVLAFTRSEWPTQTKKECPQEMAHVEGDFCFKLEQNCLKYKDPPKSIIRRCAEFDKSVCKSPRQHLDFCIDIEEYVDPDGGDNVPVGDVSWQEAKEICESDGKRLCTENEWTFACEGKEERPYPYGFRRETGVCNIDQMDILDEHGNMKDLRESILLNPGCKSTFGVHNMTGNADEFVNDVKAKYPNRSLLKGGWWGPLRNRCRVATGGHDEYFHEVQTGFRCCKNI